MPKHRSTVFAVVRTQYSDHEGGGFVTPVTIGVYATATRADEIKGRYEQEMKDKGLFDYFEFEVQASTYYDE